MQILKKMQTRVYCSTYEYIQRKFDFWTHLVLVHITYTYLLFALISGSYHIFFANSRRLTTKKKEVAGERLLYSVHSTHVHSAPYGVCRHIEAGLYIQTASSSTRALRSTALILPRCAPVKAAILPVMREVSGLFRLSTGQCPSTQARDTVRLLEQRRRSFHRIFGQRTTLTLIWLITGSGASSNSECTSRGCTTLTNWNSVCSKCGVMSTRASLTMHWRVAQAFSCMRAGKRWTLRAYAVKQYAYRQSTVRQYKRFILSNTTRFLIFFCCNLR